MKINNLLILFLWLLLQSPAAQAKVIAKTDPSCPLKAGDPFPAAYRFTHGPFKGQCIDSSQRRSVRLLADEAQPYNPNTGEHVIANFWKDEQFFIAKIKKDAVERVDWMIEDFGQPNPLSHTFLRFKLKPGCQVLIIPQKAGVAGPETCLSDDIALSIDGVGIYGFKAVDPIKGLFDNYVLAYRFMALSEKGKLAVRKLGRSVTFIPLNVDPKRALEVFLEESHKAELRLAYNTAERNCTSEAYRLLSLLQGKTSAKTSVLQNMQPREALHYLRRQKLVDEIELHKNQNSFNREYLGKAKP